MGITIETIGGLAAVVYCLVQSNSERKNNVAFPQEVSDVIRELGTAVCVCVCVCAHTQMDGLTGTHYDSHTGNEELIHSPGALSTACLWEPYHWEFADL